ncbi:hypothetical protein [Pedobacter sp. MW01-1-1]|uniref:hypothetical protein n=1 Tax=Pedobacter sp. MW01-1-1 TaxID=3383027 RepID=UPI003FEE433D
MKILCLTFLYVFCSAYAFAQKQKIVALQLMPPNYNKKSVKGTITDVYSTQRYGKTFWWVKLGADTVVHVWPIQLDTANSLKKGKVIVFDSVKSLAGDLWKRKESDVSLEGQNTKELASKEQE